MKALLITITIVAFGSTLHAQTVPLTSDNGVKASDVYHGDLNINQGWGGIGVKGMYLFNASSSANSPGTSDWFHIIEMQHGTGNDWTGQIAMDYFSNRLFFRRQHENTWQPWQTVATEQYVQSLLGSGSSTGSITGAVVDRNATTQASGGLSVSAATGGRYADKGAQLEFVIPANTDGSNMWGQGRILTVAGNGASSDATGKMILGTRRMFGKDGGSSNWNYGDDITIDGKGNVGIGTTSPNYNLEVSGVSAFSERLYKSAASPGGTNPAIISAQTEHGGGEVPIITLGYEQGEDRGTDMDTRIRSYARDPSESFNFITVGRHRVDVSANNTYITGNVGVGTSTPSEKLEVAGNIKQSNGRYLYNVNDNNAPVIMTSRSDNTQVGMISTNGAGAFSFNKGLGIGYDLPTSNSGPQLLVNGNVGIGTTNPKEKLSVDGKVQAREVKVTVEQGDWADYVFHKDYRLTSLDSLSARIKELGHLPGIPSAAEVAKEGLNLGEMNKKLLEKVEELTLYLIDMKKENTELRKENRDTRTENENIRKESDDIRRRLEKLENAK